MKTNKLFLMMLLLFSISIMACNSAKKAEAERKKTQQKMDELDQNKRSFEQKTP